MPHMPLSPTSGLLLSVKEKHYGQGGEKVQGNGVQKSIPWCWNTELMAVASLKFPGRSEVGEEKPDSVQQIERVSTVIYTTVYTDALVLL